MRCSPADLRPPSRHTLGMLESTVTPIAGRRVTGVTVEKGGPPGSLDSLESGGELNGATSHGFLSARVHDPADATTADHPLYFIDEDERGRGGGLAGGFWGIFSPSG